MKTITIKGMSCNHCAMRVTKALSGIEGIKDVKVDLEGGKATFDQTKPVDMEEIRSGIEKAGYELVS